jgi:hypothetical protein
LPFKHEPLVDAVDHFTSLLAGWVETEILQDYETVKGNKQASVFVQPARVASRSPTDQREIDELAVRPPSLRLRRGTARRQSRWEHHRSGLA